MARPVSICNDTVLAAAREVFLRHGYQASTARVARAAGISEGSLFKHFKTKADLFRAAMDVQGRAQEWQNRLASAEGRGDIRTLLEFVGLELMERLQTLMPCIMMVNASGITIARADGQDECPPPVQHIRALARYFRAETRLGRLEVPNPEAQAHAFVGAISHYVFCEHVFGYRSGPPAAYVKTVVRTVLRATQPAGPGRRTARGAAQRKDKRA
jgi:AcrR family transcriptional regulator